MPTDSNAQDALLGQADSKESPGRASTSGQMPASNPGQSVLGDGPPPSIDPEDASRSLLAELTVGSVVDGKYRIDEVLGRGAMGVVVAATHEQLGERVALKFLRYHPKPGATDDFQSRFKREARVSARLKNEHITRVIDVGVWRERVPYMVMDYLTGSDLRQIIKGGGPLPVSTALDYAIQVCEGIAEAHAHGVVHRDLKPSNLFVTRRHDGTDLVKILDFGISKWTAGEAELDELTQTGVVLGSPKYMAPEQLFGSAEVDTRADVWSIGAILYEMLAGRPAFDLPTFTKICAELSTDRPPPSLVARRPEVTPELEAVVMKCFAREPDQRTPTVADLAGELLEAVQAPFASAARARIAATLGARTGKDALSTSGSSISPLGSSGSYGAMLSQSSGTGRAVVPVTSPVPPSPEAMPSSVLGARVAEGRRWGVWIGLGAVLLVGGAAYFALAGRSGDRHADTAASTMPPVAAATGAPTTTAAATASPATSATAAETATPSPATAAPPAVVNRGVWRPGPVHVRPPPVTAAQPPTPAAPPPTVTAPPPAPTPAAATTTKSDPLGDRQ